MRSGVVRPSRLIHAVLGLLFLQFSAMAGETPRFTVSKVFTTRGGVHSTTRGTVRLVFRHQGKWLVFHGGPNMYHFSADGVRWSQREIPQFASRGYLIRGDTIYAFGRVGQGPDSTAATFRGVIRGETIDWGEPNQLPHLTLSYYEDLQQDSAGRFSVSGRTMHLDGAGKPRGMTIDWARSLRPNDITAWGPQQQAIPVVSDSKTSEVHENIPLEDGRSYIIGMVGVKGEGKLYGNLFDGRRWGEEGVLLAGNMSNVRGTDKRMSAVWDQKARVIHLSYVDHDSQLWYRTCPSPYRPQDWTAPVKLKPFKVFTNVMSLDATAAPAQVWLIYGKTLYEHPDPRWQSGELYATCFDGKSWSEPVLVSEPGTKFNWYPNVNEDASQGIGVLYLKGVPENQAAVDGTDFDIMFSAAARGAN